MKDPQLTHKLEYACIVVYIMIVAVKEPNILKQHDQDQIHITDIHEKHNMRYTYIDQNQVDLCWLQHNVFMP